jgi:hypothetical protein
VNTNGVISFLGTMSTYTPSPFPLGNNRRLVAPYWSDIDTRNGGDVWYRESTNRTLFKECHRKFVVFFQNSINFRLPGSSLLHGTMLHFMELIV